MAGSYSVQNGVARPTRGSHVKSGATKFIYIVKYGLGWVYLVGLAKLMGLGIKCSGVGGLFS